MMTILEVKDLLSTCQSSKDWNAACDKIKAAHDGKYPEFWWQSIMMSGFANSIMKRWGVTAASG